MIRRMKPEDLDQVMMLERQIFSRPWSEKSMRSALQQDTIYLVDVADGKIRGYLGIWCMAEDGDLCNMAVAEQARRGGVASRLMEEGMACCRRQRVHRIVLEVRESNLPAKTLYQSKGFVPIGVRKQYYSEPRENAVIMECLL